MKLKILPVLLISIFVHAMGIEGRAQSPNETPGPVIPSEEGEADGSNSLRPPQESQEAMREPPERLGSPVEIAANAYARGDWETAIAQYRSLLAQGYQDGALYYNLGTAYARSGDRGRAVWMLLKAQQLEPRDRAIRKNLGIIAPDLESQRAVLPVPPLEAVYRGLRLNEWALIGALGVIATCLGIGASLSMSPVSRRRALARRAIVIGLCLGVSGHVFAGIKYYEENLVSRGVVVDPETQPYSAPNEAAEVYSFTLPAGTLIRIHQAGTDGWIKAIYGGKNEVFIREGQYEKLW